MPTDQSGLWQTPIGQTWGRSTSWADSDHNLFFCKIVEDGFLDPAQYLWLSLYNLNTKFIKYQKISLFLFFIMSAFYWQLRGRIFLLIKPRVWALTQNTPSVCRRLCGRLSGPALCPRLSPAAPWWRRQNREEFQSDVEPHLCPCLWRRWASGLTGGAH